MCSGSPHSNGEDAQGGGGGVWSANMWRKPGQHGARGEIDHPNSSAGAAYAHQLVGDALVVWCPHGPDRGGDDVELGVGEWQVLGISLDPADSQPGSFGHPAPCGEVMGSQIRGHHDRTSFGGPKRHVPRSSRDVEQAVCGA